MPLIMTFMRSACQSLSHRLRVPTCSFTAPVRPRCRQLERLLTHRNTRRLVNRLLENSDWGGNIDIKRICFAAVLDGDWEGQ